MASKDFELTTKVNFLSKLQNPRIANKVAQSKEFQNYDQFSLQHCFKKALELEGTYQVSEGVNMVDQQMFYICTTMRIMMKYVR